jgi:NADP-dependent 3-hydroxy acid dehydrogenase YdfG
MQSKLESRFKVVVITGASSGVGRALSHQFAKTNAKIALLGRSAHSLEATKLEVEALGGTALNIPTDVADPEQVEAACQKILSAWGEIDLWVNNAMVSVFSPVKDMTPAEYKRVTDVTYLGVVHGTLSALKTMLPRNHGTILQVSSALAKRSIPLQSAYCAAKHAVDGFSESLRCELLHDRSKVEVIRVNLPAVNTPQFRWVKTRLPNKPQPVPPIYQPELVADAIFWACHSRKREVNIGYPTWKAIIGERIAAGFADWYLSRYGYQSQQTQEPLEPHHRDNLLESLPEKASTRGDFDRLAISQDFFFWAMKNQNLLWFIFLIALAVLGMFLFWKGSHS